MFTPWVKSNYFSNSNLNIHFYLTINKLTNVYTLAIGDKDNLFFIIMPYFSKLIFNSRKVVDFYLWSDALFLIRLGYFYMTNNLARKAVIDISNYINKNRYSNNLSRAKDLFYSNSLLELINNGPIFNFDTFKSLENSIKGLGKLKNKVSNIYIYDTLNNKYLTGSPFVNYANANSALGLNRTGRTIGRLLNTNKLYKNRYLITNNDKQTQ